MNKSIYEYAETKKLKDVVIDNTDKGFTVQEAKFYNRMNRPQVKLLENTKDITLKFSRDEKQSTIYRSSVEVYRRMKAKSFNIKNTQIISNNIHELLNKSYKIEVKKNMVKKVQTRDIQKQNKDI
jgi:hypothetical protein